MASVVLSAANQKEFWTANVVLLVPLALGSGLTFTLPTGSSGAILSDAGSKAVTVGEQPRAQLDPARILRARFDALADHWLATDFGPSSDYMEYVTHWAYRAIIDLGQPAVPLILERLARATDHWGFALRTITGENPVPREAAGDAVEIAAAWLQWGRTRGLIA
jgi:hypothetical protein